MLGVIEAQRRRIGGGVQANEIRPLVPEIIAKQHIGILRDIVNDDSEDGSLQTPSDLP